MSQDLVTKRAASGAKLLGTAFQLSCWSNDNSLWLCVLICKTGITVHMPPWGC